MAYLDPCDLTLLRRAVARLVDDWTRTHGEARVCDWRAQWWIAPCEDVGRAFLAEMGKSHGGNEAVILAEIGRAASVLAILAALAAAEDGELPGRS